MLTTTLQRDYGFLPVENFDPRTMRWWDSRELFLHGVLAGVPGCCSNLPVLFAAVGRRLGYPLRLVRSPYHLFVRWDDKQTGERFNLEATTRGFTTHPDEYYLTWPVHTPRAEIISAGDLKNLTPREELANILIQRAGCLAANRRFAEATDVCAWAHRLAPHQSRHLPTLALILSQWEAALNELLPPPFPILTITWQRTWDPLLPDALKNQMMRLQVLDELARDPRIVQSYRKPVQRVPATGLPVGLPAEIEFAFGDPSHRDWSDRTPLRYP